MAFSSDARRIAIASASGVLGRAVRVQVIPEAGIDPSQSKPNGPPLPVSTVGARGRAEQDSVVRRMQEKFGAEIRTVVDYREKR
jgi:hypothetical protein